MKAVQRRNHMCRAPHDLITRSAGAPPPRVVEGLDLRFEVSRSKLNGAQGVSARTQERGYVLAVHYMHMHMHYMDMHMPGAIRVVQAVCACNVHRLTPSPASVSPSDHRMPPGMCIVYTLV